VEILRAREWWVHHWGLSGGLVVVEDGGCVGLGGLGEQSSGGCLELVIELVGVEGVLQELVGGGCWFRMVWCRRGRGGHTSQGLQRGLL
jgi:hypothetical protein